MDVVSDDKARSRVEAAAEDHSLFPEGGFRAWGVVFGSSCIMFCVFGIINSAAVFELYFRQNQLSGYSHSHISWIFSLYLFTVYFVGILVGPVFDRFGHNVLVPLGSLFLAASPMLLSVCSEYYQIILSFSILSGLGGSLANSPAYAAIGHYFYKRRGFATGIAASAGAIGGIIFPLVLRSTFPTIGFAWSMRLLGFILLAALIPSNILLGTRLSTSHETTSVWPDFRLFKNLKFALCCGGVFFMEYGVLIPLTYIMSYAEAHQIDVGDSYMLPALLNAGSVLGRLLPGLLCDKIGRFNTLVITMSGCALSVLALWLPANNSQAVLITFTILLGFASGGNVSLVPVCVGQLCDTQYYGRYLSTAMLTAGFGTLTGIPIGGAVLSANEEIRWTGLILFSGLAYTASVVCFSAARVLAAGWGLFKVI